MQSEQGRPGIAFSLFERSKMPILLDSQVWGYLLYAAAIRRLVSTARRSRHDIVIAPATVYEAVHTPDPQLRTALVRAMTLTAWKRLMPEIYWEAGEIHGEVRRLHPEWLRPVPDRSVIDL